MSNYESDMLRMQRLIEALQREVNTLRAEPRRPLGPRGSGGGAGPDLAGEHQYQYHGMVTDNQDGYDFIRAHPIFNEEE